MGGVRGAIATFGGGIAGGRFMGGVRGAIAAVDGGGSFFATVDGGGGSFETRRRFASMSFSELSKSDKNAKKSSIFVTCSDTIAVTSGEVMALGRATPQAGSSEQKKGPNCYRNGCKRTNRQRKLARADEPLYMHRTRDGAGEPLIRKS